MKILKNYINGQFIDSKSTRFIEFMNPALDEPIGKISMSTKEEVNLVIKAAKDAYPKWRKIPGVQRIQPLFKLLRLIKENVDFVINFIRLLDDKDKYLWMKLAEDNELCISFKSKSAFNKWIKIIEENGMLQ